MFVVDYFYSFQSFMYKVEYLEGIFKTSEIVARKSTSESEISRELIESAHQPIVQKLPIISFRKLTSVTLKRQKTTDL